MYSYRQVLAIIIAIAALLGLFSCAPAKKADALDVLKLPAEFRIEGERNGVAFCADVSLGEIGNDGARGGSIVYSLPDAFSTLRVATDTGVWEAELDGIRISGKAAEALGAPLAPFMQNLAAAGAELINSENGEAQTLIRVPTGDGEIEFIIDSKSGLPIALCEKNTAGETVMEYKITDYKTQKTN